MRPGVTIALTAVDRRRLGGRSSVTATFPQKHAWRAEIVLLTADGLGTVEIMRRTGKSKTCVWRWQERFAQERVEGLLRDKTRSLALSAGLALAVALAHTAALVAASGIVAWAVYRALGLEMLRRSWFDLRRIWAGSLALVGALAVWTAV